jgi:hypothetical protein
VTTVEYWENNDESVTVQTLARPLARAAAFNFLVANSPILGLSRSSFEGYPAIREVVGCYSAGGACSGYFGELDVAAGSTVFSVFISNLGMQETTLLLDSFRIVS